MTKKDYELIAKGIKVLVDRANELRASNDYQNDVLGNKIDRTREHQQFETLGQLVGSLSHSFERQNSKFDKAKFEQACGFTYDK